VEKGLSKMGSGETGVAPAVPDEIGILEI